MRTQNPTIIVFLGCFIGFTWVLKANNLGWIFLIKQIVRSLQCSPFIFYLETILSQNDLHFINTLIHSLIVGNKSLALSRMTNKLLAGHICNHKDIFLIHFHLLSGRIPNIRLYYVNQDLWLNLTIKKIMSIFILQIQFSEMEAKNGEL